MNRFTYSTLFSLIFFSACFKNTPTPQIGDIVSYDFKIKQGDSTVYSAYNLNGDTAHIIIDKPENSSDEQKKNLMKRLLDLSEGESTEYSLPNGQKGFLTLYRIYAPKDFEKKIEISRQEDKAFEERWRKINTYLKSNIVFFTRRTEGVKDSVIQLAKLYSKGDLAASIQTHPTGLKYIYIHEGKGEKPRIKKSLIWMHFAGALPDGTFLANTYPKGIPELVNQDEHVLMKGLELAATQFKEGSKVLLILPPQLAYGEKGMEGIPPNSELVFMVEIVKINNRND